MTCRFRIWHSDFKFQWICVFICFIQISAERAVPGWDLPQGGQSLPMAVAVALPLSDPQPAPDILPRAQAAAPVLPWTAAPVPPQPQPASPALPQPQPAPPAFPQPQPVSLNQMKASTDTITREVKRSFTKHCQMRPSHVLDHLRCEGWAVSAVDQYSLNECFWYVARGLVRHHLE